MPYADYGGFGQDYFEGLSVSDPHPAGYSDYRRSMVDFKWYAQKIHDELVSQGIDPTGEKVLVVGCAYGYTVEYLIDDWDVDAYGMDVSTYAVNQADSEIAYGDRIYQGDVMSSQDLQNVRQTTQGGKFAVIHNEAVLECLTDSEAQTACENMRGEAQDAVSHVVYTIDSTVNAEWYNDKNLSEWESLCDPDAEDYWYEKWEFRP